MQVMNVSDPFNFLDLFLDGFCTYLYGCALHEHVDAVHESDSGCIEHYNCEQVSANWVHEPRLVVSQINYKARDYHAHGVDNVA